MICPGIVALILTGFYYKFFIAIKLRFPSGKFYAKGKEKTESLQRLLQKEVIDLDTPLDPKVQEIVNPIKPFTCALHSLYFHLLKQKKRHCAKRKAQLNFFWLTLPANELSNEEGSSFSSSSEFISKFDSLQLHSER